MTDRLTNFRRQIYIESAFSYWLSVACPAIINFSSRGSTSLWSFNCLKAKTLKNGSFKFLFLVPQLKTCFGKVHGEIPVRDSDL